MAKYRAPKAMHTLLAAVLEKAELLIWHNHSYIEEEGIAWKKGTTRSSGHTLTITWRDGTRLHAHGLTPLRTLQDAVRNFEKRRCPSCETLQPLTQFSGPEDYYCLTCRRRKLGRRRQQRRTTSTRSSSAASRSS